VAVKVAESAGWGKLALTARCAAFQILPISGRAASLLTWFSHGQTRRVSDFTKTMNNPVKFGANYETRRTVSGLMYKRIV